jgi:hypothetical protein
MQQTQKLTFFQPPSYVPSTTPTATSSSSAVPDPEEVGNASVTAKQKPSAGRNKYESPWAKANASASVLDNNLRNKKVIDIDWTKKQVILEGGIRADMGDKSLRSDKVSSTEILDHH